MIDIHKINTALSEDLNNSAFGIICRVIEEDNFAIRINGVIVSSSGFFDGEHDDIEQRKDKHNVQLFTNGVQVDSFLMTFTDYHVVSINREETTVVSKE